MNQKRVGSFTLWAALAYLVFVVLQLFVYTRKNEEFRGAAAFGACCAIVFIGYDVFRCWVIANAFQFNLRPERESELPEGAWNVTAAFPDPFSKPAGHFFLVLNTLTPDKQRDVYATLVVERQMLDQESSKRITDGERPMTIVIKDGIIGFKWFGTLDPAA